MEIPSYWPPPHLDEDGNIQDLVKMAYHSAESLPGVTASDYQYAVAQLKLRLLRNGRQNFLSLACYLSSYDEKSSPLASVVEPPAPADYTNVLSLLDLSADALCEDSPYYDPALSGEKFRESIKNYFSCYTISPQFSCNCICRASVNTIRALSTFTFLLWFICL